MRVIEIGDKVVDETGAMRSMILIEATRDEIRAMPNLLYREVEVKPIGEEDDEGLCVRCGKFDHKQKCCPIVDVGGIKVKGCQFWEAMK